MLAAGARLRDLAGGEQPELPGLEVDPVLAGARTQLDGVELHAQSALQAEQLLRDAGYDSQVRAGDFFEFTPQPTYDAVVGNPPYVRYQDFSGAARARAREAALRAGVQVSDLASSWATFTVHAALFCKPGGRLGLVLPAELLSVNYAAGVRRFLTESFAQVRLVLFTERVFPGVLEEVVRHLGGERRS
ncbi:Eco57I restriction-modification methylase domain-containing protein [Actinomycetospora atypica]|uniref:site-specific DNA-methyltransferase (adenine-specific) n=1 Tax=Actinomycetospora atypica TaxID=1290095 RepID=A0ABV9YIM1_9PSEU